MRNIDGKFHVDGDKIIKSTNGEVLPQEEPLFLIRARDYLALSMLRHYRALCVEDGCTDFQLNGLDSEIERFEKFSKDYAERMKQPGITRGL